MHLVANLKKLNSLINMSRQLKKLLVVVLDIYLSILAVSISYYLRIGEWVSVLGNEIYRPQIASLVSIAIALPIFAIMGFYKTIIRYSDLLSSLFILKITFIYSFLYGAIFIFGEINGVPRTIGIIQPIILIILIIASRELIRIFITKTIYFGKVKSNINRVMIYGAGTAGRQLADALYKSKEMHVVGFFDDNESLQGLCINDKKIYSSKNIISILKKLKIKKVLIAIPSLNRKRKKEIFSILSNAKVAFLTLPSLDKLVSGNIKAEDLINFEIEDLLEREPLVPIKSLMELNIKGKNVLVTGAGGTIGGELSRQIIKYSPKTILLLDISESSLYQIFNEIEILAIKQKIKIVPILASVLNERKIIEILETLKPDCIYHAAAYKHVGLVEQNPLEGLENNVLGTFVIAKAAIKSKVNNLVLISTDKAVRPTGVMGLSKRLAEIILLGLANNSTQTIFTIVRFGNVLGSSGSVVPKFQKQILSGGPITLTNKDISRYFMTITEAVQLVIQASALSKNGDLFILDMGEPIRIFDLAKKMIDLSGLTLKTAENLNGDIEIIITGMQVGEKLHEEILYYDKSLKTSHPNILTTDKENKNWSEIQPEIMKLKEFISTRDIENTFKVIKNILPEYQKANGVSISKENL